MIVRRLSACSVLLGLLLGLPARAGLPDRLLALAPDVDRAALEAALEARRCAIARGLAQPADRLALIDYQRPSTEPRLWLFDLAKPALLLVEHVAHGRGSGGNLAEQFSNREGSLQSSLGLFRAAESYQGRHGYSLRLDGLESELNDHARDRAIVVHGADYVDPLLALRQGRLGRSLGCPAVRSAVVKPLIDALKQGQLLFAYGKDWRQASTLQNCAAAPTVTTLSAAP